MPEFYKSHEAVNPALINLDVIDNQDLSRFRLKGTST